jgi:hypothetical protein
LFEDEFVRNGLIGGMVVWYGMGWYLASTEHRAEAAKAERRMMTFIFLGENVGFGLVWLLKLL